jgi:hypothetical protein
LWDLAKWVLAGLALLTGCVFAQTKEKPAGIVISSKGAQVRPARASAPLELAADDYLFPGDTILTMEDGSADVVICAKGAAYGRQRLIDDHFGGLNGSIESGEVPSAQKVNTHGLKIERRDIIEAAVEKVVSRQMRPCGSQRCLHARPSHQRRKIAV